MEPIIENKDIKAVGDWLHGTLSPIELEKIVKHKACSIEPSSEVIIDLKVTLFELEALHLFGHLPDKRNCFEIKKVHIR